MSEQIEHKYESFIVSRSVRIPVELLADVDGRHVCIARLYCWKGSRKERLDESMRLAWLLVDAIKAEQENDEVKKNAQRRDRQAFLQYRADHWLRRARPFAEKLVGRISALDERFYAGCGFHYSLENEIDVLGHKLSHQPFFWNMSEDLVYRQFLISVIMLKVRLEVLAASVAEAEVSAKEWGKGWKVDLLRFVKGHGDE